MWTKISKALTIAVTVLSVLFLGVAALTSAVSTNWKERATKDFPKSRVAELEKEKADLNAGIKAAEEQQQASTKAIEADTQALTAKNTGREAQLEAELEQLIEQAHVLAEQLEAEAKKVQLKQDEDTRLREEVTRLRSQYEDLVDQRQAALADVQRLRDLVFQARGVLQRAERRKAALEEAGEKEKKEYDPRPAAKRPLSPRERGRG